MSQPQRERALGRFASGANDVLIATDVAARGLDLEDITHVINFDAPADEKDYVHRVGRTARAGRGGEGITFVTPEQELDVSRIATKLKLHAEFVKAGMRVESPRKPQHQRAANGNGSRNGKGNGNRYGNGNGNGQRRRSRNQPRRSS
jgi:superfamily II DNA/RNA helicase